MMGRMRLDVKLSRMETGGGAWASRCGGAWASGGGIAREEGVGRLGSSRAQHGETLPDERVVVLFPE